MEIAINVVQFLLEAPALSQEIIRRNNIGDVVNGIQHKSRGKLASNAIEFQLLEILIGLLICSTLE